MKRIFAAVFLTLTLAMLAGFSGCATPTTGTTAVVLDNAAAQRAVFDAKTGYAVALTAAVAYKRLAPCTGTNAPLCSKPAVVAQLQKADTVAAAALDSAESVVRTPGFGANIVSSAVQAATAAVGAFVSITATLGS
jgi:hypothetical protein